MPRTLSPTHWSELQAAHRHLGLILQNTGRTVSEEQWTQLETMRAHLEVIVGRAGPLPSSSLFPSLSLYP